MKISNYFTEKETLVSSTAEAMGIKNKVSEQSHKDNIKRTAFRMDLVRAIIGKPLKVNSFFRTKEVNDAINGSKTSNHMNGLAVDVTCKGLSPTALKNKIVESGISFDQLIVYSNLLHVGFKENINEERKQIIIK